MSTTGASADPLAALGSLPGVAESVESVRKAVDRVYGHRIMRRRSNEITSEAALRGARGSAALSGADWALEEVRRRTDFSADDEARVVGAALRLTAEAGQLLSIWRQSPLRVLARLHLVAAADKGDDVGRPRRHGEPVDEPLIELPLPEPTRSPAGSTGSRGWSSRGVRRPRWSPPPSCTANCSRCVPSRRTTGWSRARPSASC